MKDDEHTDDVEMTDTLFDDESQEVVNPFDLLDEDIDDGDETVVKKTGLEFADDEGDDEAGDEISKPDADDVSGSGDGGGSDDNSAEAGSDAIEPALLLAAGRAGLTEEQVKAFPTAGALKAAIALKGGEAGASSESEDDNGGESQESNDVLSFKPVKVEVPDHFDEEDAALLTGIQDQFNEQLKGLTEAANARFKQMGDTFSQVQSVAENAKKNDEIRWFDGQISSLDGGSWESTFGKGTIENIQSGSEAANNRVKVFSEMNNLRMVHPDWSQEKLFESALAVTFPEQSKQSLVSKAQQEGLQHKASRSSVPPSIKRRSNGGRRTEDKARETIISKARKYLFG